MTVKGKDIETEESAIKKLFGIEPEMSLQTVNFATTENHTLSHYQVDDDLDSI